MHMLIDRRPLHRDKIAPTLKSIKRGLDWFAGVLAVISFFLAMTAISLIQVDQFFIASGIAVIILVWMFAMLWWFDRALDAAQVETIFDPRLPEFPEDPLSPAAKAWPENPEPVALQPPPVRRVRRAPFAPRVPPPS
jgi:hypothetical protein